MRRSSSEFTAYDRATAVIHTVDDAEIVIAKAIKGSMNRTRDMKEQAHEITQALDKAGFEIRYRPLDILPDEAVAHFGKDPVEISRQVEGDRRRAVDLGLAMPAGSAARVGEARRTGDWSKVSDADWRAWVYVMRPQSVEDAIARLARTVPLTQEAVTAGVEALERAEEDAPGYLRAVRLLRGRLPSIKEIVDALGGASPDGSQGNVWALRQQIVDRRPPSGPFWGEPEAAPFEPASEPKLETGRVVVLDEAGERKLQDLLAGKAVPTGRLVEVTYLMPNGIKRTVRHAEFGKLDSVSYDPLPPVGASIEGATVLSARETVKVPPGEKVVEVPGLMLRDNGILAVFYDDGIISFAGDAADLVAFRDMAARVVGVPGSRDAA